MTISGALVIAGVAAILLLAVDASLKLRLGRWLIALAFAQQAARAEITRCYQVWKGEGNGIS